MLESFRKKLDEMDSKTLAIVLLVIGIVGVIVIITLIVITFKKGNAKKEEIRKQNENAKPITEQINDIGNEIKSKIPEDINFE